MLTHLHPVPAMPERVVVLGAGGFVGRSVVRRLAADDAVCLPLTRGEIDLLAEGAARTLSKLLRPGDGLVMISATVPARTPALLAQNVRMVEAVGEALAEAPVAHVVYVSSDAVYADGANPVTETSCCQPPTLHGMMHATRELVLRTGGPRAACGAATLPAVRARRPPQWVWPQPVPAPGGKRRTHRPLWRGRGVA